jgi:magnesium chelatase subunit I
MPAAGPFRILPYSAIVGQKQLKLGLQLAFIEPAIGGLLISGQRGTAKSTAVRAFAQMMYDALPTTLPLNASEDRVVGDFKVKDLVEKGEVNEEQGILEKAHQNMLYIDEVNLLEEHLVDIILDVTATGILTVERNGQTKETPVKFTLVGTMNPEEGWLRPQLIDRFGLMVAVATEAELDTRMDILRTVLAFDAGGGEEIIEKAIIEDRKRKTVLLDARERLSKTAVPESELRRCVDLVHDFKIQGHRGEHVMVLAARAHAALRCAEGLDRPAEVTPSDVRAIARMALEHRRGGWDEQKDNPRLER